MDFTDRKLELDYPCEWGYTLIGPDEFEMRTAIADLIGDCRHKVRVSRRSAMGRYVSLELLAVVDDEEQRHGLFHALRHHPSVRFVL